MIEVHDGRGILIQFSQPPQRIISLVPSTTETVFALGCGEKLVGRTRFCVHPKEQLQTKPKVGGTKDIALDRILKLKPDLVLANVEENTPEIFSMLEAENIPVYAAFPRNTSEALEDLEKTGKLLGVHRQALAWCQRIQKEQEALTPHSFRYCYLIWRKPWMAVGHKTFISAMLSELGGENLVTTHKERYPEIRPEELVDLDADYILLSSEPFPFQEKHKIELAELSGLPKERFVFVDGEMCSWHGVRMAQAFPWLNAQLQKWSSA